MHKILVIDDDIDICHLLKRFLSKNNYEVLTAHSGETGLKLLQEHQPDLVMTDFRLGDMDGSEVIQSIKAHMPQVPILVITGYSDIRVAINVMKLGALDYITKPLLPQEILMTIQRAIVVSSFTPQKPAEETNISNPKQLPSTKESFQTVSNRAKSPAKTQSSYILGTSIAAQTLIRQVDLVAQTNYSVIIYGESGSGKEAVARMIHDKSPRANMPFVAMDCGAIPKELANSELFGHEKGSFTGAIAQKIGLFEMANGGTLFLDEVANLTYDVQISLLRVVQERKLKRIGSNKEVNLDVRIIVASNEKLSEAARKGKFREDLYHRFNEFSIDVPPLRERKADIMLFADYFLAQTSTDLGRKMNGFEPEVENIFQNYAWYGNIRELKNVIKRAALLSDGDYVQAKALPFEVVNHEKLTFGVPESELDIIEQVFASKSKAQPTVPEKQNVQTNAASSKINLKSAAQDAEYELIMQTLQQVKYNKSKAAEQLGIDRKTLYNKLKKLGIE
ncbi:MAG: sigma-54-dependent Fis family transcriptional regulator [Saprospiraceae bacterium]|nr:sigma-54-dependent Fis family transcriptional regulator [Saprospiraceae bacterium]